MPKGLSVALDPAQLQEPIIWEGWGTSLAWFAVALGGHEQLRQHISTLLFSREPAAGLGMNIVRYELVQAAMGHSSSMPASAAVIAYKLGLQASHAIAGARGGCNELVYAGQCVSCEALRLKDLL